MQISLQQIMEERFPAFDQWAMSAEAHGFAMSMVQGSDRSAIMEALEANLIVLGQIEDHQDMVTGAMVMFLFGMFLGQTRQGWLEGFGEESTMPEVSND